MPHPGHSVPTGSPSATSAVPWGALPCDTPPSRACHHTSSPPAVKHPYSNFFFPRVLTLLSKKQSSRLLHAEKNNCDISIYYSLRDISILPRVSQRHKAGCLKEWISDAGHFTSISWFLGDTSVRSPIQTLHTATCSAVHQPWQSITRCSKNLKWMKGPQTTITSGRQNEKFAQTPKQYFSAHYWLKEVWFEWDIFIHSLLN